MCQNTGISFSEFIKNHNINIIIPLIQREYAQGRDNIEGEEIRKNFVPELIRVLTGEKETLELDFVFGVMKNKEFIPLDGQQRLTTLLLLHWYFGECLSSWKYQSRRMANSFVDGLLNSNGYQRKQNPSEWIKAQNWFFENWLTDPTVSGMLTMLDAIHEEAKGGKSCDSSNLDKIKFFIHEIDPGLDADNAYTKMNARGEPLTDWENIKALLDKKARDFCFKDGLCNESKCILNQWLDKIDSEWLLALEKCAGLNSSNLSDNPNGGETESPLESAIKQINCAFRNIFDLAICVDLAKEEENTIENTALDNKEKENKKTSLESEITKFHEHNALLSDYHKIVSASTFESAARMFNVLIDRKDQLTKNWNIYHPALYQNAKTSNFKEDFLFRKDYYYSDCVRFYAISRFQCQDGNDNFSTWTRVVDNIIENGGYIDKLNLYKAIDLIDELSAHSGDILSFLSGQNEKWTIKSNFASDQVREECLKASLICSNNDNWEEIIIEAENHPWLKGKINILFINGDRTDSKVFNKRSNLLNEIYKEDKEKSYWLQKVLLSYCNDDDLPDKYGAIDLSDDVEKEKKLLNTLSNRFNSVEQNSINEGNTIPWVKDLVGTKLLEESRGKLLSKYPTAVILWGTNGKTWNAYGNIVLGKNRNLLTQCDYINDENGNNFISSYDDFVDGNNVTFQYSGHWFRWFGVPKKSEYDVYLLKNEWKKADDPYQDHPTDNTKTGDAQRYYCFNIDANETHDSFKGKLDSLI